MKLSFLELTQTNINSNRDKKSVVYNEKSDEKIIATVKQ
jgi:hypothetical protein